ncbi:hypothetical protein [Actinokineospora sp. HUAS TT18]|uniref:hypothetical protein n=1 Tax=Actinokineospora sp. HUAS TT18 TaxID=3447451 RepID=UPI003F5208FF
MTNPHHLTGDPGLDNAVALYTFYDPAAEQERADRAPRFRGLPALPEDVSTVEELFEFGHCNALALALHERTGWPIVGLVGQRHGEANHYLVRRPDGLLVDVRGARTEAEVLAQWGEGAPAGFYTVEDTDAAQLWAEAHSGDMEDPAPVWDVAQAVTSHLLATPESDHPLDRVSQLDVELARAFPQVAPEQRHAHQRAEEFQATLAEWIAEETATGRNHDPHDRTGAGERVDLAGRVFVPHLLSLAEPTAYYAEAGCADCAGAGQVPAHPADPDDGRGEPVCACVVGVPVAPGDPHQPPTPAEMWAEVDDITAAVTPEVVFAEEIDAFDYREPGWDDYDEIDDGDPILDEAAPGADQWRPRVAEPWAPADSAARAERAAALVEARRAAVEEAARLRIPGKVLLDHFTFTDTTAFYANVDCARCDGDGLIPTTDHDDGHGDTDTCPCVTQTNPSELRAAANPVDTAVDDALDDAVDDVVDDDLGATSCRCCGGEFRLPVDEDVDLCTTCAEGERAFDDTTDRVVDDPDQVDGDYLDDAYVFTSPEPDSPWGSSTSVPPDPSSGTAVDPWRAPAAEAWTGPRREVVPSADPAPWEGEPQWPDTQDITSRGPSREQDQSSRLDEVLRSAEAACDRIDTVLADTAHTTDRERQTARWCAEDRAHETHAAQAEEMEI